MSTDINFYEIALYAIRESSHDINFRCSGLKYFSYSLLKLWPFRKVLDNVH